MKHICFSNSKHPLKEHSKKDCVCGCHNNKNHKKHKNNNSTKQKLNRRKIRRFLTNNNL